MIIIKIQGGLGNQLFNYAFGRKLSYLLNTEMKLDISYFENYFRPYQLNLFNITESFASKKEIERIRDGMHLNTVGEIQFKLRRKFRPYYQKPFTADTNFRFDPNFFKSLDNTYFSGTWQSEKYFSDIREIIVNEFTVSKKPSDENIEMLNKISTSNSVSLHIRRGDYVTNAKDAAIIGCLPISYYDKAISHILEKVENPHFYVFSDDLEWVGQNLNIPAEHTMMNYNFEKSQDFEDFRLMCNCRHHIVANSTFSWWGAWLSVKEGIKISPSKWFISDSVDTSDVIPESWFRIS